MQAKVPAGLSRKEAEIFAQLDSGRLPRHIAIIMDGNGRWARKRHLPRVAGHRAGAAAVRSTLETAARIGIPALTLYAFSEENWKRPKGEVDFLMRLLWRYLKLELPTLIENNVRLEYIGRQSELPEDVQQRMHEVRAVTAHCTGMVLTLALNYSGRTELVDAFRAIMTEAVETASAVEAAEKTTSAKAKAATIGNPGHLPKTLLENLAAEIAKTDEAAINDHLYTRDLPDPDLVIRTSGEMRLSNFLLWQLAYAEILVTPTLWPDFRGEHLLASIAEFQTRERRYGGLGPGDKAQAGVTNFATKPASKSTKT